MGQLSLQVLEGFLLGALFVPADQVAHVFTTVSSVQAQVYAISDRLVYGIDGDVVWILALISTVRLWP